MLKILNTTKKNKFSNVFGTEYQGIRFNISKANFSDEKRGINKNDYVVTISISKDIEKNNGWFIGIDSMKEFAIIKAIEAMTK